jgi:NAD(P)-dependent dehydrogenase (short-subunit alcohol dehydrogenase family)
MTSPFSYVSKRVVITGGATGIGDALLRLLSEIGAPEVIVLDRQKPTGPHTTYLETDLSDREAIDNAIDAIDGRVDGLFNNAGVAATQPARTLMAVNYLAARRLSVGLLDQIPRGGAIVNTASIAGDRWATHIEPINELLDIDDWNMSLEWVDRHCNPGGVGADLYAFSKEVLRLWGMRSSRSTIARGIRTNSVCPAPVATPLLADFQASMGKSILDWTVEQATGTIMTPREVAMPLAFLGSAAAAYINGHDLVADGGFNASLVTGQLNFEGLTSS